MCHDTSNHNNQSELGLIRHIHHGKIKLLIGIINQMFKYVASI